MGPQGTNHDGAKLWLGVGNEKGVQESKSDKNCEGMNSSPTLARACSGRSSPQKIQTTRPARTQIQSAGAAWYDALPRRRGGANQKIYCIPGHAERVLCIDTATDEVYPIGPEYNASNMVLNGKFKWLRGIVVGDIVYGLPCHADYVLRIDTMTDEVTTIDIPYKEYFDNGEILALEASADAKESPAHQEQHCPWKYHGGGYLAS